MELSDFDFDLPEDLIALRPAEPRRAARLLVADGDATHDRGIADLPQWLRPGDVLVLNDTRVIPARLFGLRRRDSADGPGAAKIEVTLIHRDGPARWQALARPARRLAPGDVIGFGEVLSARVVARDGGIVTLDFDRAGADLDAGLALAGVMPLPPYIARRRAADARDMTDYQTVFAARSGAVAAPTASLHFDEALLAEIAAKGVHLARVTLHVGAGTFLPVTASSIDDHAMHAEWGEVTPEAAALVTGARARGGRVIAAGTTALRLLESAATADGRLEPFEGETAIFIRPGHRFRITDGLMTNFHLPKSTLFMLVSALMGRERMQALYAHAIAGGYRFYSYGDGSLLLPARPETRPTDMA